jgi:hypothetical protein
MPEMAPQITHRKTIFYAHLFNPYHPIGFKANTCQNRYLEATEVFLCTGSGTKLIADEGLKIAGFKRDLNGDNKELFPAPALQSNCERGFIRLVISTAATHHLVMPETR